MANRVAIRVDGIADYHKDTENLNLAGRAGLSLLINWCATGSDVRTPDSRTFQPRARSALRRLRRLRQLHRQHRQCARIRVWARSQRLILPALRLPWLTAAITGPIYFDFDKSDIRPDAAATLDRKIPWLTAQPRNADTHRRQRRRARLGRVQPCPRPASCRLREEVPRRARSMPAASTSSATVRSVLSAPITTRIAERNRRDDFVIVTIGSDAIKAPPME